MLIIARNRPRVSLLTFLVIVLMTACLLLLFVTPALAAPTEEPAIKLNLNAAILWTFLAVTGLLVLKQVFAVMAAVKDKTFTWRALPDVLRTNVLPFLIPLAGMAALSLVMPAVAIAYAYFGSQYIIKLLADIKESAGRYFGLSAPPDVSAPNLTE